MAPLSRGTIIRLLDELAWGKGCVKWSRDDDDYLLVRFDYAGWKIISADRAMFAISQPDPPKEKRSKMTVVRTPAALTRTTVTRTPVSLLQFTELLEGPWPHAHHCVYVVELRQAVLKVARFRAANPNYIRGQRCVYVGMTGLTPEERFENHQQGIKSSKYVRDYGVRLAYDLFDGLNPMPYEVACCIEAKLAHRLRDYGYAVWQH